jgi:hypothetical protein
MHLPETTRRVEKASDEAVNARNRERLDASVARFEGLGPRAIEERLHELDREWDTERALEANAAVIALAGVTLGAFVDRRWLLLPAAVATFLLQHALQGWCPPLPVMRRLGIRTQAEIEEERTALRVLRGDFRPTRHAAEAVAQALAARANG